MRIERRVPLNLVRLDSSETAEMPAALRRENEVPTILVPAADLDRVVRELPAAVRAICNRR